MLTRKSLTFIFCSRKILIYLCYVILERKKWLLPVKKKIREKKNKLQYWVLLRQDPTLFDGSCLQEDPKLIGLAGPNTDRSWRNQHHGVLLGRMTRQLGTHLGSVSMGHVWQMDLAAGPTAARSWCNMFLLSSPKFLGFGRGCQTQVNNNRFYPSNKIYVFFNSNKIYFKLHILMNLIKFIILIIILKLFGQVFIIFNHFK